MADLVAVLRKALDDMGETTPAMRARVYDKARDTIAAKLTALNPPPPASVAEQQKQTLEDAITVVEADHVKNPALDDALDEREEVFYSIDRNKNQPVLAPRTPEQLTNSWLLQEFRLSGATEENIGHFRIGKPSNDLTPKLFQQLFGKKPPEPIFTEGPNFELKGSKLAGSHSFPKTDEAEGQTRLHEHLRKAVAAAEPMLAKVENKFPEIVGAYREYVAILDSNTDEIDVVALWSVGGALLSFADAYREQNRVRTLAEPLEPQTAGALQSITRLHGAFVMGFEEGRDLVLKADEFLLNTAIVGAVSDPGSALLDIFASDKSLIEPRTLKQNRPIRDYVHEFGWTSSRAGYSAYIIVRNGVVSLLKLVIGAELTVANVTGAALVASAIGGDPNAEFVRAALPIIHQHGASMLAFFSHSPEFRAYIEWALNVLETDGKPPAQN